MAEARARNESTGIIIKYALWAFVIIFVIFVVGGALKQFSGQSISASGGDPITTIECTPDEHQFDRNGGWCYSEELEPGTYRIEFLSSNLRIAHWQDGKIAGHYDVPPQGIGLSFWKGQAYERDFVREAAIGKMKMVGAPIARIDNGAPFDPKKKGSFTLERAGRIGISINNIPQRNFFVGNTGKLVMEIQGEAD